MRKNFALESHFCRYPFYEWQTLQHLLNEPEKSHNGFGQQDCCRL